ncbi:hypothetical protein E2C01_002341 [Portunus trituberculatus]|uniref:Uncharacterized protein n=1 Tax=Portunus trituberculatus TaxID=210409 RepID=A0A5B7CLP6_PORTR|nr:hypothetical protein [Portunus trituberculatus]
MPDFILRLTIKRTARHKLFSMLHTDDWSAHVTSSLTLQQGRDVSFSLSAGHEQRNHLDVIRTSPSPLPWHQQHHEALAVALQRQCDPRMGGHEGREPSCVGRNLGRGGIWLRSRGSERPTFGSAPLRHMKGHEGVRIRVEFPKFSLIEYHLEVPNSPRVSPGSRKLNSSKYIFIRK